jgi:hypothetical protein
MQSLISKLHPSSPPQTLTLSTSPALVYLSWLLLLSSPYSIYARPQPQPFHTQAADHHPYLSQSLLITVHFRRERGKYLGERLRKALVGRVSRLWWA